MSQSTFIQVRVVVARFILKNIWRSSQKTARRMKLSMYVAICGRMLATYALNSTAVTVAGKVGT